MSERNEVLEELYVLWVETQILQCGLQGSQEIVGVVINPGVSVDTDSSDTSSISSSVAIQEGQLGIVPVDEPTGEAPPEGVWSSSEVAPLVDLDDEGSFDPQQF